MAGKLSTHVLDLTRGGPAAGLKIELWRWDAAGGSPALHKSVLANADGRTDQPLLGSGEMKTGAYEIVFCVGDYFAAQGRTAERFLDRVPVRFHLADAAASYHVPLLFTPWAYSTYRGS